MLNQVKKLRTDHTPRTLSDKMEVQSSLVLNADTQTYTHKFTWIPERYMIVVRLSAGSLTVNVGNGRNVQRFRMDKGTIKFDSTNETLTIETNGATGFYDVYALIGFDQLDVTS